MKGIFENIMNYLFTIVLGFSILFILMVPTLFFVGLVGFFVSVGFLIAKNY